MRIALRDAAKISHAVAALPVMAMAIGAPATAAAVGLPEGRAYEMVSPPAKNLAEAVSVLRASDDGDAVAFGTNGGIPGATGAHIITYTVAHRGAAGWELRPADAPGEPFASGPPQRIAPNDVDPGMTRLIEGSEPSLVPDDVNSQLQLYRLEVGSGAATWLSRPEGVPFEPTLVTRYGASSADLSRVFFTAGGVPGPPLRLLPDAPDYAMYEWRDGHLRLVSVDPDGAAVAGELAADAGARSGITGSSIFSAGMAVPHRGAHAVSDSGSSVIWSTASGGYGTVYISRDGQRTRTVAVGARFVAATHDHSVAYLVSSSKLTPDATNAMELYRWDAATGALSLLTPSPPGGSGAQVVNGMASDDGSHVYFTGYGALTPDAVEGALNAYVWSSSGVRFIATIEAGPPTPEPVSQIMRVNRDGSQALIQTRASLVGARNDDHWALYAYDDRSGNVACVSCRPDGTASEGDAFVGEQRVPLSNSAPNLYRARTQTDDGRVFFQSRDRLVPTDVNNALDVYEWHDGQVSLLSDGRNDSDSFVADNGDDGRDVFMLTRARLVATDTDDLYDVYDVRVGGGFPAPAEPAEGCAGDDCRGPAQTRPNLAAPGSVQDGAGTSGDAAVRQGKHRVVLAPITPAQRRQLVRAGSVRLLVRVAGGGKVTIRGRARVGTRMQTFAIGSRAVRVSATVATRVRVRLSRAARVRLAHGARLRLTFSARLPGAPPSRRTATLTTTAAPR